jgi:electron transfer flavoprotein beta subunit
VDIVTCLKHVAAVPPEISGSGAGIKDDGLPYEVNEADLYALEVALEQRARHGGLVTAVTVGPGRAREAIHVAYAKGADRGVHIEDETEACVRPDVAAEAVAQVVRRMAPDLVLAGVQASDDLAGLFGIALADALGMPAVTGVVKFEVLPEAASLLATCELSDGYKQEIEAPLPCLLTIQSGIVALRYTPVLALAKARRREIESVSLSSLDGGTWRSTRRSFEVVDLFHPEGSGTCEMIQGSPDEAATYLVERLQDVGIAPTG